MIMYCDSSTHAACFVLEGGQEPIIVPYNEKVTVNTGEYKAILVALRAIKSLELEEVELLSDSLLAVNQINGVQRCKAKHLIPLRDEARELAQEVGVTISWVPREENQAGLVLG